VTGNIELLRRVAELRQQSLLAEAAAARQLAAARPARSSGSPGGWLAAALAALVAVLSRG
jgi:hypothetical protein